jgi:hypothetical protein
MFELIRRFKLKIKKITTIDAELVLPKFFKEFPRIAKNVSDLERIVSEGYKFKFMAEEDGADRKMSLSSQKPKRAYNRK